MIDTKATLTHIDEDVVVSYQDGRKLSVFTYNIEVDNEPFMLVAEDLEIADEELHRRFEGFRNITEIDHNGLTFESRRLYQ